MTTTKRTSAAGPRPGPEQGTAVNFQLHAQAVLNELRSAFVAIIGALPGTEEMRRPADLQRRLKLDSKLAWQIHKVAFAADPVVEAGSLPKSSAMRRFVKIAREQDVPAKLAQNALAAVDRFDELIKVHAGDRNIFDSMISAISGPGIGGGSEQINLNYKRTSFTGNSHIWGVQARTQLTCFILNAAANDPVGLDIAVVRGLLKLRRFRPDASWTIARLGASDDDGVLRRETKIEALDPGSKLLQGIPLMREFCSQPLPRIRSVSAAMGMTNLELEGDTVGNLSAVTYLAGDVTRNACSRFRDENNRLQVCQSLVRTPCEVLIHDVLVGEGVFGPISPQTLVYGDQRSGDAPSLGRECDLLPLHESVMCLGKGPSVLHTPDVPRYAEMVQYAMDRLGWDGGKYEAWRCRVEYPVMPSSVVVQFDLPEKPQE